MSEPKASLRLTFESGRGESYTMMISLDESVASDIERVPPLPERGPPGVGMNTFEEAVEVLQTRQFRKDLFIAQAHNLGALLAERMEDAEGWHDQSRVEPAKAQLRRQ